MALPVLFGLRRPKQKLSSVPPTPLLSPLRARPGFFRFSQGGPSSGAPFNQETFPRKELELRPAVKNNQRLRAWVWGQRQLVNSGVGQNAPKPFIGACLSCMPSPMHHARPYCTSNGNIAQCHPRAPRRSQPPACKCCHTPHGPLQQRASNAGTTMQCAIGKCYRVLSPTRGHPRPGVKSQGRWAGARERFNGGPRERASLIAGSSTGSPAEPTRRSPY